MRKWYRQLGMILCTSTLFISGFGGNVAAAACTPQKTNAVKVILNKNCIQLKEGKTCRLKVSMASPKLKGEKLTYASTNPKVAKVSQKGNIRAVKKGTTWIKVKMKNGQVAKCKVTVKKPTALPTEKPIETPNEKPIEKPVEQPETPVEKPAEQPKVTAGATLSVHGTQLKLGESSDTVKSKLGNPDRTEASLYGDTTYIYNKDYSKLVMVYLQDNKVVGYYTDATDFSCNGVNYGGQAKKETVSGDGYTIRYYVDKIGDGKAYGVRVLATKNVTKGNLKNYKAELEQQVFDLTNSIRVRNGLSALVWSDKAANSARGHSKDMADNGYFSHTGLDGSNPGDRMKKAGINWTAYGENIIGGYGDAVDSTYGWYQSAGHRSNMLNKNFTYLGVGMATGGNYGNYYTQNFYR